MDKKAPKWELENVSNLLISSEDEKTQVKKGVESKGVYSDQTEEDFEVEETVSVRKKIAYPDTRNAQEDIRRSLYELLQEDYIINRIELRKTTDTLKPKNKKNKEEEIIIFLKPSPSP